MIKTLEDYDFELTQEIDTPVEDVLPNAKQYTYQREDGITLTFDTQQGFVQLTKAWYSPAELRAILAKAEELGV